MLDVPQLFAIALVISAAAVFFDTAYMSIVPGLVSRTQLNDANSRLQISSETARAAGPGLGGVLAKFISAAWLPLAATFGYFVSAFAIWRIPADEPPPRAHDSRFRDEIREGVVFVFRNKYIRPVVLSTTASNLFGTIAYTMIPVLLLRYLEPRPAAYGLLLTLTSIGGIAGAFSAPWFAKKFGDGHAIAVTYFVASAPMFLMAASFWMPREVAIVVLAVAGFWGVGGIVAFNVVQVSMRQRQSPPRMLARMTASIRMLIWGVGPHRRVAKRHRRDSLGARSRVLDRRYGRGARRVVPGVFASLATAHRAGPRLDGRRVEPATAHFRPDIIRAWALGERGSSLTTWHVTLATRIAIYWETGSTTAPR